MHILKPSRFGSAVLMFAAACTVALFSQQLPGISPAVPDPQLVAAIRDVSPANVRLLTKELQNDSTLGWEPSPGESATGYEVLWCDTAASDWQHVQALDNVTQATVPVSKDNVVFAVRALDAKGHRSLSIIPVPER